MAAHHAHDCVRHILIGWPWLFYQITSHTLVIAVTDLLFLTCFELNKYKQINATDGVLYRKIIITHYTYRNDIKTRRVSVASEIASLQLPVISPTYRLLICLQSTEECHGLWALFNDILHGHLSILWGAVGMLCSATLHDPPLRPTAWTSIIQGIVPVAGMV